MFELAQIHNILKTVSKLFLIISIALSSCKDNVKIGEPAVDDDGSYIPVSNVSTEIKIDSFNLKLETTLAVNYMPSIPPGGPFLNSLISLTESTKREIKGKFDLISFRIFTEKTWGPTFTNDSISSEKYKVVKVSNNGPKLKTGRLVDVVCEFKYLKTGQIYEILASRQVIKESH